MNSVASKIVGKVTSNPVVVEAAGNFLDQVVIPALQSLGRKALEYVQENAISLVLKGLEALMIAI
jgi:hypothetical protein